IGCSHQLSILAGQTDDGESQEGSDRAKPADRGSDMGGERKLAEAGCHDHSGCTPCSRVDMCMGVDICMWPPKPWPVSSKITNSRTRTMKMIPNTFTQRGVPVVDPRSGLTRVLLLEDGAAMCVPSSVAPRNTDFFI